VNHQSCAPHRPEKGARARARQREMAKTAGPVGPAGGAQVANWPTKHSAHIHRKDDPFL